MNALSVRGLVKTYKNGVQALKGIDLDVEQGDFFALLGPNGAGKTTLIGIATSLVNKTAGTLSIFGHDIDRDLEAAKACVGVVPQEINFNMFESPQTILVNQAGFYGIERKVARERAEKYLKELQLWDKRDKMSRSLSGGMKRRLMIARALMNEPRLLILDEPTAGVDIEIRRSMWEFLRGINEQGTTIILTTHYLEEAETLCRNIAIIDKGQIAERDRMSSLLAQAAHGNVRAQPAQRDRSGAEARRLRREPRGRSHAGSGSVEGTEPQRNLLPACPASASKCSACVTR